MSRILVVDDDVTLLRTLVLNLRTRQYDVDAVPTGHEALSVAARTSPDLAIVDLGLPDMDGLEVIAQLRRRSALPILVLSARTEPSDEVAALDAGSDDHISKPFGMEELLARVRAGLRRSGTDPGAAAVVTTASFTADLAARSVSRVDGTPAHLTPTRVASARGAHQATRTPGRAARPAPCRVGQRLRAGVPPLPARLHGTAAPQARDRPLCPATPDHRPGQRISLRALTSNSPAG